MKLKDYLYTNRIDPIRFALDLGISVTTIYRYLSGAKPFRKTAYKIEKMTNGQVTLSDLLGE